jgi:hypothetical protein
MCETMSTSPAYYPSEHFMRSVFWVVDLHKGRVRLQKTNSGWTLESLQASDEDERLNGERGRERKTERTLNKTQLSLTLIYKSRMVTYELR